MVAEISSSGRWQALVLIALAELLGMTLWFSASSAIPELQAEWSLTTAQTAWLTLAVQFGFVAGTLFSALINLPDIISVRRLFAVSAMAASATSAAIGLFADGPTVTILLRFMTGFLLAGVYPPGMKLMATWFRRGRGMAIGVLVAALTLGKASPYLIAGIGDMSWRQNELIVSIAAMSGGLIVLLFVREGPYATPVAKFDIRQAQAVLSNRSLRLANFGYFGHMWELYAMWTWVPVMIRASLETTGHSPGLAEISSFLVLGSGAAGCVLAGLVADRIGRTIVTSWAMGISGFCCLTIGFLFGSHPSLLVAVAIIWGFAVVADSAQFSACITELGDPRYIGTALTLQTCLGFLLTTASVRIIPTLEILIGWKYVFMILAPGPVFGIYSMLRLRSLPESTKIAQGRK